PRCSGAARGAGATRNRRRAPGSYGSLTQCNGGRARRCRRSRLLLAATPPQLGTFSPPLGQARCRQVLIVEDNVDQAQTLRLFLSMQGHRLEIAATGPAALGVARRFRPDVVLLDLGLPAPDGFDADRSLL